MSSTAKQKMLLSNINVQTTHQSYVFAPHQYGGFVEGRAVLGVVGHQSVRRFPHCDHVNRLLVQLGGLQLTCLCYHGNI